MDVSERLVILAVGFFVTSVVLFAVVYWNHLQEKKMEKILKRIERMNKLR